MDGTGVTRGRSDTPTWPPFAAAGGLVVLVIVFTVLLNSGGASDNFDLRTSATIPSGHASAAVVHIGDTVRGSGNRGRPAGRHRPVLPAGGERRGSDVPAGAGAHRCRRPAPHLHNATITGIYRGRSISVTDAKPYNDHVGHPIGHDVVPCTPPDGGWPRGEVDMGAAQRYRPHTPATLCPGDPAPVADAAVAYVITSGDPTDAGDALTKTYGKRLCVVQSPFSAQQIAAAKRLILSHVGMTITDANPAAGRRSIRTATSSSTPTCRYSTRRSRRRSMRSPAISSS